MGRILQILLAEDNPGDVFLVKQALRQHSVEHVLTIATDGQSAWQLIEAAEELPNQCFDIVLLDLNLPVRPGLEALDRIRASAGKLSRALVIIMTSSSSPRDRLAAADADYYFVKPFTLEAFLELGSIVRELWTAREREERSRQAHSE